MQIDGDGAAAVEAALVEWAAGLDRLIALVEGGGLGGLDQSRLLQLVRLFEQTRHRTALIDHALVHDLDARGTAETLTQPGTATLLSWLLGLSRAEAARRVRGAEQLGGRTTMTGERLEPLRPALAAAQREGAASPEQVDICLRAIEGVDHRGFDPADLEKADVLLAGFARTFPPAELRGLAQQVVDRIDPDGTVPQERRPPPPRGAQAPRRRVRLRGPPHRRGGRQADGGPGSARGGADGDVDPRRRPRGEGRGPAPPRPAHARRTGRGVRPAPAIGDAAGLGRHPHLGRHHHRRARPTGAQPEGRHQRRHEAVGRHGGRAGRRGRALSHGGRRGRRRPAARPNPPSRLLGTDGGADRSRRRVQLSRLLTTARVVRAASRRRLGRRWPDGHGQRDPALPLSPPPVRRPRLDLPHGRRPARLVPTAVDRPSEQRPLRNARVLARQAKLALRC